MTPKKIPITISPFFWIFALVVGWVVSASLAGTLIWAFVIIGSVLVHELGHALVARSFGQTVAIHVLPFGGYTERGGSRLRLWQDFLVTLAGPLAGFFAGLAAYAALIMLPESGSLLSYCLKVTILINWFWCILNLVPVVPLDGGRLFTIVMESAFGFKGVRTALFLSVLFGVSIGLSCFVLRQLLPGTIFMLLSFESFRSWRESMRMSEKDKDEKLQHLLREGEEAYRAGHIEEALAMLQNLRTQAGRGVIYVAATQLLARSLEERGRSGEAYSILEKEKKILDIEGMRVLHRLAYLAGHLDTALEVGNISYQNLPSYDTAIRNALCCALLEQVLPCIGWIECAMRQGIPDLEEVLRKEDFDKIRQDPRFQEFVRSIISPSF